MNGEALFTALQRLVIAFQALDALDRKSESFVVLHQAEVRVFDCARAVQIAYVGEPQ